MLNVRLRSEKNAHIIMYQSSVNFFGLKTPETQLLFNSLTCLVPSQILLHSCFHTKLTCLVSSQTLLHSCFHTKFQNLNKWKNVLLIVNCYKREYKCRNGAIQWRWPFQYVELTNSQRLLTGLIPFRKERLKNSLRLRYCLRSWTDASSSLQLNNQI